MGGAAIDDAGQLNTPLACTRAYVKRWRLGGGCALEQNTGVGQQCLQRHIFAAIDMARQKVGNIDATILCQRPKLAPHIPAMRRNIADAFGLPVDAVSVKATTEEHLGFTGEGLGIAAHAVALIE